MVGKHFSLNELTRSATALRHGIVNTPGQQEVINLTHLVTYVLEPVRQYFNIPYSPSSAYRSAEVNHLVGSAPTSQHIAGQAADFEIPTISNEELALWIKANLTFDQLILEFHRTDDPKSGWVHCSYHADHNRNECLIFDGSKYKEF